MTPTDKCPKCGAPLDFDGASLYCGSWFDSDGKLQEGTACKLAQRAQREKKRGDAWKACAKQLLERIAGVCDEDCIAIDNFERLMKEENEGQAPLV